MYPKERENEVTLYSFVLRVSQNTETQDKSSKRLEHNNTRYACLVRYKPQGGSVGRRYKPTDGAHDVEENTFHYRKHNPTYHRRESDREDRAPQQCARGILSIISPTSISTTHNMQQPPRTRIQ